MAQLRHNAQIAAFALSPDGATIATGAAEETALWTLSGTIGVRMPHGEAIVALAFAPDGQTLVTSTGGGTLGASTLSGRVLWEYHRPGKVPAIAPDAGSLRGIAFDPSGANVVVTFEDAVVAFDARTGKSLAEFRHDARITGMVTTADLAFMATTALDGTSRIWNVREGREVIRFPSDESSTLLGFDPSSQSLLVGTGAGIERRLWRTGDLVERACASVSRNFTADEWQLFRPDVPSAETCIGKGKP